ncbi:MAG: hypothetical protein D6718_07740, partial [Acidobacteria bacterium]
MTPRARESRERLYRYLSVCLSVATALLLLPPEWIRLSRTREEPREVVPREVKIVRVPPETLPPPPPLPPRPKKRPRPRPQPP